MFGYVKIEALNNCKRELAQAEESIKMYRANEETMLAKIVELNQELADSKATTFPDSRFNISKAVTLLTTKLSDKTLASFCFKFTEELQKSKMSHLVSLNNYTLRQLSKDNK